MASYWVSDLIKSTIKILFVLLDDLIGLVKQSLKDSFERKNQFNF